MAAVTPPRPKGAEAKPITHKQAVAGLKFTSALQAPLLELGQMCQLLARVVVSLVREPRGIWHDVRDQMWDTLRLCLVPMAVACTAFGFGAPGLQAGNLYLPFGIPERLGSFFVMASVREFAPWINAMVVAGVVGTAITADLGARRTREEIDAMEVLGIDPVRTLILPRVIAVTIMTGLLDLLALVFGVLGGYIAAIMLGASSAAFQENFFANATTIDLVGSVLKTTIFGLIIAVVCCYKGFHASGGPAGVGRAVNQAVVVSFVAIWTFNFVFTTILLGLFPQIQVYR